jgi:hypothetical protein
MTAVADRRVTAPRVPAFLSQLDQQRRRFYLAYDPVSRLGVLRHKDDGAHEWRGRRWRMFGGTAPVINEVDVRDLLTELDAESSAPVPRTRYLWWSAQSGFVLRSSDTAPEPDEVLVRDAYDLPAWRPEFSLIRDVFPVVGFDGTIAILRLRPGDADVEDWLNGRLTLFDSRPAALIELDLLDWLAVCWQLVAWPRDGWAAVCYRTVAPRLVVCDGAALDQDGIVLRDVAALPLWATEGLNVVPGVEPGRTLALRQAAQR